MPHTATPHTDTRARRRSVLLSGGAFLAFLLTLLCVAPSVAIPGGGKNREGDVLKIFDKGRVYVVTNDDAALADTLLEGARQRERRVLTPDEWRAIPNDIRRFVSVVFLVNREYLPLSTRLPEKCDAERDEVYTNISRLGNAGGVTYELVISAPDSAWLRQGVMDFRKFSDAPRGVQKHNVRSLAVVPIGAGASRAADSLLTATETTMPRAHLISALSYPRIAPRVADMDELFLIDRSAISDPAFSETLKTAGGTQTIGAADTVVWRERKPGGRSRIYISAPTGDHIADALKRFPNPLTAPETLTIIQTARDLRAVRRVAVATIKQGVIDDEEARRIASKAATELRGLDAFEVLERAGLSEILGEVALGQAGITRAADRTRVRQLAAADALLIVDVTGATGRTDYTATYKRLTAKMGPPPRKPAEPSRLKVTVSDNPVVQGVAESVLGKAVGTKSDSDYRDELNYYNNESLPRWQRQVDQYNDDKRRRSVSWEQSTVARCAVTITGSLRLVDLTDGLVLWEAPFTTTERQERPDGKRTITVRGEDSQPGQGDVPLPIESAPESLIAQVMDSTVTSGIGSLRATALLPSALPLETPVSPTSAADGPATVAGKVLDLDGDIVLIGLGASDGLKLGDILTVTLPDSAGTVRLTVTRVRPRTCDATFDKAVTVSQRAGMAAGLSVAKEPK